MAARFSNVAHVILGFLAVKGAEPLSGYDLKQHIDNSVRFFFAASYGQIYPELKRLSQAGLVEGVESPTGGRARTAYAITDAGHEELRGWLLDAQNKIEMRDEGMLRIFFSDDLTQEERIVKIKQLRDERAAGLAILEAIRLPEDQLPENHPQMPGLVLDYGIGLHEYVIGWCDRSLAKLENPALKTP